jgi:hypothetical protein
LELIFLYALQTICTASGLRNNGLKEIQVDNLELEKSYALVLRVRNEHEDSYATANISVPQS